jgi:magnesium-transporting ATPase (P-type)
MMMVVHEAPKDRVLGENGVACGDGSHISIVKGAPNMVLEHCTHMVKNDGSVAELPQEQKDAIMKVIDALSDKALRVLAVAYKPMDGLPYDPQDKECTSDMKFKMMRKDLQLLGLFASIDPDRPGVPEAVADAESANIKIVMITGDYVKTAIAIARNIGILLLADDTSDLTRVDCIACDCVNLRPDGEYLPQDQLDRVVSYKRVFARAQPEDKLEIVKSLQRQNKVIAMTGDGVNDAPALNRADIGVAMGIQGTEVAKGASDMILTDDNFISIIKAVEKGRVSTLASRSSLPSSCPCTSARCCRSSSASSSTSPSCGRRCRSSS